MTAPPTVHLLFPAGYDDPRRPSGGNGYDQHVRHGLGQLGWTVVDQQVTGAWPAPTEGLDAAVQEQLARLPDGALVVFDGLLGSAQRAFARHADRLRLVALVHMPGPPGGPPLAVLQAARLIVTTSDWTARVLIGETGVTADRVVVARPGVDPAPLAPGTPQGGALLCVAPVRAAKGQDILVDALAGLDAAGARDWTCTCVGAVDGDPRFVEHLRRSSAGNGIDDRVSFTGARTGADLDQAYAAADVLVLPTRLESYGMVVTEALARGLPVIASDVGGVAEALGHTSDGRRPGLLVPPDDVRSLRMAISDWLTRPDLRDALRARAHNRRTTLSSWADTAGRVAAALACVAAR
jgi:glycosyltransferase involved in cell wall biosynthesis